MPYKLMRMDDGYIVENVDTKHRFSNTPQTKEKAEAQMRLLNGLRAHEHAHHGRDKGHTAKVHSGK